MTSRLKSGACALVISGALLSISAPAIAGETHQLSGDFAPFDDCPLQNPAVALCMVAKITAGELVVGRRKVPIGKPLEIQAGLVETTRLNEYTFAAAEDGNTLSKTTLSIPGGLTGTNTPARATAAGAVVELAKSPASVRIDIPDLIFGEHSGLELPLKVKLNSPTLGSSCYIGSSSDPLMLNLVTGKTSPPLPNRPIEGSFGQLTETVTEVSIIKDSWLVDNSFGAPAVTGCPESRSPMVSLALGVPSAAGRNTAILTSDIELVNAEAVRVSE